MINKCFYKRVLITVFIKSVFSKLGLIVIFFLFGLQGSYAQKLGAASKDAKTQDNPASIQTAIQLAQGETIDFRTGRISWVITLANIVGSNGLDIPISLEYNMYDNTYPLDEISDPEKHTNYLSTRQSMAGTWDILIPTVQFSTTQDIFGDSTEYDFSNPDPNNLSRACQYPWTFSGTYPNLSIATGAIFKDEVAAKRTFLTPIVKYAENYDYITDDNWVVKCKSVFGFDLNDTQGNKYTLDKRSIFGGLLSYIPIYNSIGIPVGGNYRTTPRVNKVHISEKSDNYGNKLTYHYDLHEYAYDFFPTFSIQQQMLSSISASDGRKINFSYIKHEDSNRKLLKTINYGSKTWTLNYNEVKLVEIVRPDNKKYTFGYDSLSRLSSVSLPEGANLKYTFNDNIASRFFNPRSISSSIGDIEANALLNRTEILNDESSTYTFAYTKADNINSTVVHFPDGETKESFQYKHDGDHHGYIIKHDIKRNNALLRQTEYVWEIFEKIGDAVLFPFRYGVGGLNHYVEDTMEKPKVLKEKIITIANDRNYITRWKNFNAQRLPRQIEEIGTSTRITNISYYNSMSDGNWIVGLPQTISVVHGGTVTYAYNDKGKMTSKNEYGIVEDYTYHTNGDLHKRQWKQKQGHNIPTLEIVYTDYFRGIPQKETYPEGIIINREIDTYGRSTWEEDGNGNRTQYKYDNLDRVIKITPPTGFATNITWGKNPTTKVSTRGDDSKQSEEIITYDGFLREISKVIHNKVDSAIINSIYSHTQYDNLGRVIFESHPSFSMTDQVGISHQYDSLSRLIQSTNTADDSVVTYKYNGDISENVKNSYEITDERGYKRQYNFRSFGDPDDKALIASKIALDSPHASPVKSILTTIERNLLGNITKVIQGGFSRTFTYESNRPQLLSSIIHPETGTTNYGYDLIGNRISENLNGANTINYIYDANNRLIKTDYTDGTSDVHYSYDDSDNVVSITNTFTNWTYQYNTNNLPIEETLAIDGKIFSLNYDYDAFGYLSQIIYPSNTTLTINNNALGLAKSIGSYVTGINYHPNNNPKQLTYGNGTVFNLSQNNRQLVSELELLSINQPIIDRNYGYDLSGNVDSIVDVLDSENTITMQYDGANRLIEALSSGWGGRQVYDYDAMGNITAKTTSNSVEIAYSYNSKNQLTAVGNNRFTYDAFGNVISKASNFYGDYFDYNRASQLISVTNRNIDFIYDGNGHRAIVDRGVTGGKSYSIYNKEGFLMYQEDQNSQGTDHIYLNRQLIATKKHCGSIDSDSDNIPDCKEKEFGLNPNNAEDANADFDNDGLTNLMEYQRGTNPRQADTDSDGILDRYEIENGLNPLNNDADGDLDNDGITNINEFILGTKADDNDTDNDGIIDGNDNNPLFNPAVFIAILSILF